MTTLPSMNGAPWRSRFDPGHERPSGADPCRGTDDRSAHRHRPPTDPSEHGGDVWVTCEACGMDVRADRLSQHRATQH